jgi:hypothetical protein
MRAVRTTLASGAVALLTGVALVTWGGVTAVPVGAADTTVTFTENGTFTVPDGVNCLAIFLEGAAGGAGSADTAAGGAGGRGAQLRMLAVVEPGVELGVFVGAEGSDGSAGTGGGGGGPSAVLLPSGEPFAVAGGGGGGGSASGTDAGGAGGDGGEAGTNGALGAAGSATAGGGGSSGGPGGAGANDGAGTAPTAGAAEPPNGGTGGGGARGGGGGGGGYFGGGGGGSGATTPGAGGGGGGSAVNPAVESAIIAGGVDTGYNDGAGSVTFIYDVELDCLFAPLTVKKVVDGPAVPGTTFVERLSCTTDTLVVPIGSSATGTTRDIVFTVDENGVAQPAAGYTVSFREENSCTVTETVDGGAESVAYTCEGAYREIAEATTSFGPKVAAPAPPICGSVGPSATPITVSINEPEQIATVTVTSTFAPVPEPRFTG